MYKSKIVKVFAEWQKRMGEHESWRTKKRTLISGKSSLKLCTKIDKTKTNRNMDKLSFLRLTNEINEKTVNNSFGWYLCYHFSISAALLFWLISNKVNLFYRSIGLQHCVIFKKSNQNLFESFIIRKIVRVIQTKCWLHIIHFQTFFDLSNNSNLWAFQFSWLHWMNEWSYAKCAHVKNVENVFISVHMLWTNIWYALKGSSFNALLFILYTVYLMCGLWHAWAIICQEGMYKIIVRCTMLVDCFVCLKFHAFYYFYLY